ncbi:hypothetical protein D3C74_269610 [compost metagenome]
MKLICRGKSPFCSVVGFDFKICKPPENPELSVDLMYRPYYNKLGVKEMTLLYTIEGIY